MLPHHFSEVTALLACIAVGLTLDARDLALGDETHVPAKNLLDTGTKMMQMEGHTHAMGYTTDSANSTDDLVPVPHKPKHSHGMSIIYSDLLPEERLFWDNYSTETFFTTESKHRGALYVHIASFVSSYVFVFPFVLLFWNTHHSMYLPAISVHTALVVVSSLNFWIFEHSVRNDLYPHSAFSTMTVILFMGALIHWAIALLALGYRVLSIKHEHRYANIDSDEEPLSLASPTPTLNDSQSPSNSFELEDFQNPPSDGHLQTSNDSMTRLKPSRLSQIFDHHPQLQRFTHTFGNLAVKINSLFNWVLFAFFLIYFPTGVATYLLYGQDEFKFNLLAHFIKGGVFFVLGLVTLARYCGAFKNKGWAWNHRFVTETGISSRWLRWQSKGLCTMEMIESCLILFYGSTNIFMEHMASPDGVWTAKDLQHVSIAFIYIGCGLCGALLEIMLAEWRFTKAVDNISAKIDSKRLATVKKATPGFSPNPFPALTIYWTGVLMSLHEQASQLSSQIHKQWGNMFVLGCAFRVVSYLYFLLKPNEGKSLTKPAYPITELLVSFCLIAGGTIFMESCDSVVYLLEYYGLTSMFTLNLCLGFAALIMAWVMVVFFIKDVLTCRAPLIRSLV